MADFPRWSDLFETALREVVSRNTGITEEAVRQEGTEVNAICAAIASVGEEVVRQAAIVYRDRLLTTAQREELDRLAWDWFGLVRNDATKAKVTLRFTRTGTASGVIPEGFRCATASGIEFETVQDLAFQATETSKTVEAWAVVAGPEGNVAKETITVLRAVPFDTTMTVTNPQAAAGGSERESDDAFRARCRAFWAVVRRGTLQAIEHGARSVSGVGIARASEMDLAIEGQSMARWVRLVVADPSGRANDLLRDSVATALDEWRPCGVYVEVVAASLRLQRVRVTCAFRAGADTVETARRIRRAIVTYVNSLRVGERLSVGGIREVVRRDRDVALSPEPVVVEPAGDVVPGSTEVVRTQEDMVTINA